MTTATIWKRIKHYKLGDTPVGLFARHPVLYRCIVAKRALLASYELADDQPEDTIVDLLADLRHLCDRLKLDYDELDRTARGHHEEEHDTAGKKKGRPRCT